MEANVQDHSSVMKANPGGHIDSKDLRGRQSLIDLIWERLDQQCVLINAERRIGKTSVIKAMNQEPKNGWVSTYQDLEKVHSSAEFAREIYQEARQYLGPKKYVLAGLDLVENLEFKNTSLKTSRPWKTLLTAVIADLVSYFQSKSQRFVFFWDEVPYMLETIRKREGEQSAIEVLDTLRSLRLEHPDLRMVLTGSMGMHHVIGKIRAADISTSPVNDMYPVEVAPLDEHAASFLATELIQGESIVVDDLEAVAKKIATAVDCWPFFIHHVVYDLKLKKQLVDTKLVSQVIQEALLDSNDPWHLKHFQDRIAAYYTNQGDEKLAFILLDQLAAADDWLSVNALETAMNSQTSRYSREHLLMMLKLLAQDHYIHRDMHGHYQFRFPLIRHWWQLDRGL